MLSAPGQRTAGSAQRPLPPRPFRTALGTQPLCLDAHVARLRRFPPDTVETLPRPADHLSNRVAQKLQAIYLEWLVSITSHIDAPCVPTGATRILQDDLGLFLLTLIPLSHAGRSCA